MDSVIRLSVEVVEVSVSRCTTKEYQEIYTTADTAEQYLKEPKFRKLFCSHKFLDIHLW